MGRRAPLALVLLALTGQGRSAPVPDDCGSLVHAALGGNVSVLDANGGHAVGPTPYCLVKVLLAPAINIWVGLPAGSSWNGRLMALGGGGFAGSVGVPTIAIKAGYAGATTDTGHQGSIGNGTFAMAPGGGAPNSGLQTDFGWRSIHMMAVVSKQLIQLYYGRQPEYSYWNGCSTGGRQGLAMAQRFPGDYDGILAGAPAIHFGKVGLGQTWPQVPMLMENGGRAVEAGKEALATAAAISACDALDGVTDRVLRDPRACKYSAAALVAKGQLTVGEAEAIDRIWRGPTTLNGSLLWYGIPRGAALDVLAGEQIFPIAEAQARYWVEYDPKWNYTGLAYGNWAAFFDKTVMTMGPGPVETDNAASIAAFRDAGHKLLMWHGWSDQIIMPQGSIDYFNQVTSTISSGNLVATQQWYRLFMVPGVDHCGMDTTSSFAALVDWVEKGRAPERVVQQVSVKHNTSRLLCPHPAVAIYDAVGGGRAGDSANFECGFNPVGPDTVEHCNDEVNLRLFGKPFVPSAPCPGC